ncbi:hypothetical protein D3C87_2051340 [compost metagenome]
MPAGVVQRHVGGCDRKNNEMIDLALLLELHPVIGIERAFGIARRDTTGDLGRKIIDLEFGHEAGTTFPGEKFRPGQFSSTP